MIEVLSSKIVEWLLNAGTVSKEDRGLYEYATYSLLFSLMPLVLVMLLSVIFGMLLEGVLMILPFLLIRKFSGGYHLKSPAVCLISSTAILSGLLAAVGYVIEAGGTCIYSALVFAAGIHIFFRQPIDNASRPLTARERAVFKKVARIMTCVFLIIYSTLLTFDQLQLSTPIGGGVILTALLQLPCYFHRYRNS